VKRQLRKRLKPSSLGLIRVTSSPAFVNFLRHKAIRPHIAQIDGAALQGSTFAPRRHASYWVSPEKRKRVEEIFGWMKAYGAAPHPAFRASPACNCTRTWSARPTTCCASVDCDRSRISVC